MPFQLPDLPYAPNALEPAIDAKTMEVHHGKHHAGYVAKLNAALEGTEWAEKPVDEVLRNLDKLPADKQGAVRNNGGGHYNHSLFWPCMAPKGQGGEPSAELAAAIDAMGGMDACAEAFKNAALNRFGSGWAWVCAEADGTLHVTSTANQDNPIMPAAFGGEGPGHTPILGVDVWEHAYYLNYQNRRPDYVDAFLSVINWQQVSDNYAAAKS